MIKLKKFFKETLNILKLKFKKTRKKIETNFFLIILIYLLIVFMKNFYLIINFNNQIINYNKKFKKDEGVFLTSCQIII